MRSPSASLCDNEGQQPTFGRSRAAASALVSRSTGGVSFGICSACRLQGTHRIRRRVLIDRPAYGVRRESFVSLVIEDRSATG
jgi:hypothetical protein